MAQVVKRTREWNKKIVRVVSCASILVAAIARHLSLPWYATAAMILVLVILPAVIWTRRSLQSGLQ